MKAKDFDQKFDRGQEDIIEDLDLSQMRRPRHESSWIKYENQNWFRQWFGNIDEKNGAPCAPPGETRQTSDENSSIVVAYPERIDIHISHSAGLEHGPIIQRKGDSSPFMEDPEQPGDYTSDPDLQRVGSYFLLEEKKKLHIRNIFFFFAGSYILLSDDEFIGVEEASKIVREVLLGYFPLMKGDLPPTRFVPGTFASDIISFQSTQVGFLNRQDLGESLANLFNKYLDGARAREAEDAIEGLYEKRFPRFLFRLNQLSQDQSFVNSLRDNTVKYLRLLLLLLKTPSHENQAKKRCEKPILFMQGCGDLTMNEWNVAFLSGKSYKGNDEWVLLHAPGEPLNDRTYTCLIKWSCNSDDVDLIRIAESQRVVYPYQIARIKFLAPSLDVGPPNRHVFLGREPIGHLIEFAVYGQQLCADGEIPRLESNIREFSDIRHIFRLPNLNKELDYSNETAIYGIDEYGEKPRNLFNQNTFDDVWLGEKSLIQGDRNLRVAALNQAIQIDLKELGAPKEWIEVVLKREEEEEHTYRKYIKVDGEVLLPGQWRWIEEGRNCWLEIYFLPNQYPCSMIGVRAEDERKEDKETKENGIVRTEELLFLVHGHNYTWKGCTIHEAAEYFNKQCNAWNILMFDEGRDVFQLVRRDEGEDLRHSIPLKRNELRCVFFGVSKT